MMVRRRGQAWGPPRRKGCGGEAARKARHVLRTGLVLGLKAARLGLSEAIRALDGRRPAADGSGPKFSRIDVE